MKTRFYLVLLFAITVAFSFPAAAVTVLPPAGKHTEPDPALVRSAAEGFRNLTNREKKARLKMAKKELKEYKKAKRKGAEPDTNTLLLVIIAILLPPLAVYLYEGEINNKFWITLLLWVLGILGGFFFSWFALLASIVYALIVVLGQG